LDCISWTVFLAANLDPGVARLIGHDLVRDHAFILRHRIVVTAPDQHLHEVYLKIDGRVVYLWRAVTPRARFSMR